MQEKYLSNDLLNNLILTLVKEDGSDIHLVADMSPAVRIHGELIPVTKVQKLESFEIVDILKLLITPEQYEKYTIEQQVDFSYTHSGEYRLRGHAFVQKGKTSLVMRLVPKIKDISELNLPKELLDVCKLKQGFFLVVGPVGQGKSTTLASMINYININEKKIISTIEDPIEYIHESKNSYITQREIGTDAKSFASALEATFRQDVDVILLGEMRDADTIRTAVTAAETGHLVFSTLHTNSASQTIDRVIDSFPSNQQDQIRSQLASSLVGVFSQRLLPKIGGGLMPIYELLMVNSAVQNLIREKRSYEIDNIIETGAHSGMISFDRCLAAAVIKGDVPIDEALLHAKNKDIFQDLI
jgi:twitching motility protein PilT